MKGKRKINWFRTVLIVMVTYFGYVAFNQQIHMNDIEQEQELANARLSEAQQMNHTLLEEKENLNRAEYIEKIAREELGLVKPGEMPYISSNKS
ncbi:FtsB family cell division protein [Anaerosinus massiliensis]|uniref:FtsB family cell division protein n=1 Tax=Massilibacillus massiliensis TaxID=1806837 RepID=UPI000A8AAD49|nr:septum formation initiator family protein [Massilibacillus massiliensis]